MKKIGMVLLLAMLPVWIPLYAECSSGADQDAQQVKKSKPVEVYYFHMTRRCMTCQTVEKVAEEAVRENFKEALDKGEVTFKSVNLEKKENKDLIKRMKVSGQSLLIVRGSEKIDITDKGFMYAVNDPGKLKLEIKSHVEKLMK